jgi:hypothetical protein
MGRPYVDGEARVVNIGRLWVVSIVRSMTGGGFPRRAAPTSGSMGTSEAGGFPRGPGEAGGSHGDQGRQGVPTGTRGGSGFPRGPGEAGGSHGDQGKNRRARTNGMKGAT